MTGQVDTQLPVVSFTDLEQRIRASKSEKSVRNYVAVVNRLKDFTGVDSLGLRELNTAFVTRFSDYLLHDGMTQSSVNHFKMILRAMFKDEFGKEHYKEFKEAFKDVSSTNTAQPRTADFKDAKKLLDSKLNNNLYLLKIRDLFMFCVFGGGMTYVDLKTVTNDTATLTKHQRAIINRFRNQYHSDFFVYTDTLTEDNYAKSLLTIGELTGLSHPLLPKSAMDIWILTGLQAGMAMSAIERAMAATSAQDVMPYEVISTREIVSNQLWDLENRWYVMRCYDIKPAAMRERIQKSGILDANDVFETFIAPEPAPKVKAEVKNSIMDSMLFFNCQPTTAATIRNAIKDTAWVYTLAGTTTPAYIPNREMKTFMLICDISDGTLSYHFPQSGNTLPDIKIGQQARITNGTFAGLVGIVSALPNNKCKVVITFTTLCAHITAEVPIDFLQFT